MNTRMTFVMSALAVLLLSSSASGQDGFSAGLKVIGNANKFAATKRGFGYGGGGFATLPIVGPLSVRGEVLYVSYSGTMSDSTKELNLGAVESVTYKNRNLRFHSVETPVMAVVDLPILKNLNPKLSVGYAWSYNFGVYQVSDNTYSVREAGGTLKEVEYVNNSENVTSEFEPFNSSVLGSLSFNFERIHADFRYQQGFTNLSQHNASDASRFFGDYRTKMISFSLGYRFF